MPGILKPLRSRVAAFFVVRYPTSGRVREGASCLILSNRGGCWHTGRTCAAHVRCFFGVFFGGFLGCALRLPFVGGS